MLKLPIASVREIAERQLCCGCGACAYVAPQRIRMVDDVRSGRRPIVNAGTADATHDPAALAVCPGIHLEHTFDRNDPELIRELTDAWGPVYEVWEGHASDPELRFAGSSGGAASALALHAIKEAGFAGVLHIAARPDVPYLNHTVLSTTRAEILERTGSRYAPASPCDGLRMIENAPGPCVFIGKPCDVAAVQQARRLRPQLDAKLGLTIAFFCAGTPTTRATLALLRHMGVDDPSRVVRLRYRGHGWPGRCVVTLRTPVRTQHASAGPSDPPLTWRALSAALGADIGTPPPIRGRVGRGSDAGHFDPPPAPSLPGRGVLSGALSDLDETVAERSLSYEESWGLLARDKQWRCHICPDHTGEFADIAVGDPWYRSPQPDEVGTSLIVARTPRGRELLHAAAQARCLTLATLDPTLLPRSQPNLLAGRGAVWARLLGMALCGLPRPSYVGFPLYPHWRRKLPLMQKLRSTLGTLRRIASRRLYRRNPVLALEAPRNGQAPVPAVERTSC